MAKLLVLHGPNLNLLGCREPDIYGKTTLAEINQSLQVRAFDHQIAFFQSQAEHEICNEIHRAFQTGVDGIVFNPAAFTHTSIMLRDALLATAIPFVEVHLSNIFAREPFRKQSFFSDIAIGVITGFGKCGYQAALDLLINKLESDA